MLNDCITVHNEQQRRRQYAALFPRCPGLDAALDKVEAVERYDPPIVKSYAELTPGDICRSEYGDDDNWIDTVFVCFGYTDNRWTEIVKESVYSGREMTMWSQTPFDKGLALVVGRRKE